MPDVLKLGMALIVLAGLTYVIVQAGGLSQIITSGGGAFAETLRAATQR